MRNYVFLIVILVIVACSGKNPGIGKATATDTSARQISQESFSSGFPYKLNQPDQKYKMPKELTEISAIASYRKSKLACVQDEAGKVFIYDLKEAKVKEGIDFGKKGDYEGIATVNDTIYVLSSNGNLRQIVNFDTDRQKTIEIKTPLDANNDTEGLCYDAAHRRLLIACKKDPGSGLKGVRAVYAFNLGTMQLELKPVYVISLEDLKSFLIKTDRQKLMVNELKDLFDDEKGDVTFQPSEIAVHPITKEVFLIATVGKLLVALENDGSVKYIQPLNEEMFKQPEGLCFNPDGTMYIADEGRSGNGNIFEFKYHANAK